MTYLSGSAISGLLAISLMHANRRMRAGHFGPLLWRAGRPYARLSAVEQRLNRFFSEEQLAGVSADHAGRIIQVEEAAVDG
jgi:hypothetical protein